MSTPAFDPQPCCGSGQAPLDVNVTNESLDVNVLGTVAVAEPVDVNVLGTVPVSVTGQPIAVTGTVSTAIAGSTVASATLTTASAISNGTTVDFANAKRNVTLFALVNGTVTSGVVDLQASQDGTNWVKLASTGNLATGVNQYLTLNGGAFRYFRGVVSEALVGGGSVTATLMYA